MNRKFVFDIDGTLTPSRQKMDLKFAEFFLDFCKDNKVYLVTGSDRKKTEEQLDMSILDNTQILFNCAGNEAWKGSELLYRNNWEPPKELIEFLEVELKHSKFQIKTGNHFEKRSGMLNFSLVGRNCNLLERQDYVNWDKETKERELILQRIKENFPDLDIFIGGETGLDIFMRGMCKSQTINHIRETKEDYIYYFGDQIFTGGNDYNIALLCNTYRQVKSWKETHEYLLYIMELI